METESVELRRKMASRVARASGVLNFAEPGKFKVG
jgi:hypothetical protein